MLEWIIKYWLEIFFGAIVTTLTCVVKYLCKVIQKEHQEQVNMREGILALLKNSLIKSYNDYMSKEAIPVYALDSVEAMYAAYHALGGNGTVTGLVDQLKQLPHNKE